ncbi:CopG family ribbon-helix-helix protein [Pleurocapsa sp. FMAR1]|uniref:CopG family ribbon-helix-helix protein n=1 Tax=Pleurocapsa sp. FMAR1 TaxID=3040204 RepID=UPI0029C785AD|nr:ribbon-helix-helix protein, CopG family [Pleurocapsa sp. FMAR1]
MRTTITIPDDLAQQIDKIINQLDIPSRNQFIIEALEAKLKELEDRKIDDEFALMAEDLEYRQEALDLEQEFIRADFEVTS